MATAPVVKRSQRKQSLSQKQLADMAAQLRVRADELQAVVTDMQQRGVKRIEVDGVNIQSRGFDLFRRFLAKVRLGLAYQS